MKPVYIVYGLRGALVALFIFAAIATRAQSTKEIRDFLVQWEGYSTHVATRSNGERVVGVGHNLKFSPVSASRNDFTTQELDEFFAADLKSALSTCRRGIESFDILPVDAKLVSISLSWTVGPTGFAQFHDYRSALGRRDYRGAAKALLDSRWRIQVGERRARHHYSMLLRMAK